MRTTDQEMQFLMEAVVASGDDEAAARLAFQQCASRFAGNLGPRDGLLEAVVAAAMAMDATIAAANKAMHEYRDALQSRRAAA